MRRAKRIKPLLLAIVIIATTVMMPLKAAAYDFSQGYIDIDEFSVKAVLERMEAIGHAQAVTLAAYRVLSQIESGKDYDVSDILSLNNSMGLDANGIFMDVKSEAFENMWEQEYGNLGKHANADKTKISSGMYIEEVLTNSANDGTFQRYQAKNIWAALAVVYGVEIEDIICGSAKKPYKEYTEEELGTEYKTETDHTIKGLYNKEVYETQLFDESGDRDDINTCREAFEFGGKIYYKGNNHAKMALLERFNRLRDLNGWTEINYKDKMTSDGDDAASMDYFLGIGGYGIYRQEILHYCIPPAGSTAETEVVTWTSYDIEANDGRLKEEEIEVYKDRAPGNIPASNYTSFSEWANGFTCREIVERASDIAKGDNLTKIDEYNLDRIYRELLNKTCSDFFAAQYENAKKKLTDYPEKSDDEPEDIKLERLKRVEYESMMPEISTSQAEYPFITSRKDENGEATPGFRCIETTYLEQPNQVYSDPDILPKVKEMAGLSTEESCYNSGGALTWIVCPLIKTASEATVSIYEGWIEPNLIFDGNYLLYVGGKNSSNSDTSANPVYAMNVSNPSILVRRFWSYFRTLSNMLIILVFLVVIASQLTGLGIDNYGIKKLLPKIIAISILVNLSYWISLIAIDAANISGQVIKNLFEWLNSFIVIGESSRTGIEGSIVLGATLKVIVAGLTIASVVSQGWGILVPIVAALVAAIIGILALFAVLALRIVVIWTCVAISGIAIASYILPNTKKLFDIWFGFFWKALLCYPICSFVVYGGQVMARLVIAVTGSGPSSLIIALVLCVGPLVMLPTIIKSSFAAARNAVAAIDRGKLRLQGKAEATVRNNPYSREYIANRAETQLKNRIKRKAGYKYNPKTGQYENHYGLRGRYAQQILDSEGSTVSEKTAAQKYLNSVDKKRANYREKAEGIIAREGAQEQYYGENGLLRVNQIYAGNRMKLSQQNAVNNFNNGDYEELGNRLGSMLVHGRVDNDLLIQRINSDDGSAAYEAAGIMSQMSTTSKGREHLTRILREATSAQNSTNESKAAIRRVLSVAMRANPDFLKNTNIEGEDIAMSQYLEDVYHGKQSAQGSFDEWRDALTTEVFTDDNGEVMLNQNGEAKYKTNGQAAIERVLKKPSILVNQGDQTLEDIKNSGLLVIKKYKDNLRNALLQGNWTEKSRLRSDLLRVYAQEATNDEIISLLQSGRLNSTEQSSTIKVLVSRTDVSADSVKRLLLDQDFKPSEADIRDLTSIINRSSNQA